MDILNSIKFYENFYKTINFNYYNIFLRFLIHIKFIKIHSVDPQQRYLCLQIKLVILHPEKISFKHHYNCVEI